MSRVARRFAALQPRERRFVVIGAIAAVLLIIIAGVLPLHRARASAALRVEHKRADLAWLNDMAPQLAALQATAPPPTHESLVVLVDRVARESGLSQALNGSQPSGDGGLRVRLQQAPFDTLIAWLSQLAQRYGVRVDSATIDTANAPGTVNASLVLRAP